MLAYIARMLPVIARAMMTEDGALISQLHRRVGLSAMDINRHMNQAVYAQIFELGRTDWLIRSGGARRWRADGVNGVVASQHIVYRRELGLGVRYTIDTRAIELRGRLLLLQGHVLVGQRVHTRADVEVLFIGPDGVLDAEAAAGFCAGLLTAPLPVEDWAVATARGSA